ncbi:hypothetical protein V5G65_09115 [Mammaliicoccus sciuri]|uniref:hypothetical protein n=1 Tax=Mammaliicoccus sciuri TaxID=1296 RepID=UPI0037AABDD8
MTESKYEKNLKDEKIIGGFLDKYFYPIIEEKYNSNIKSITRNFNVAKQHKGIDVILEVEKGYKLNIDEKAATEYLNKNIPTFALEISFLKDKNNRDGWLFGEKYCDTDTYLFCWGWKVDEHEELTVENIQRIEAYSVRKNELQQLLEDDYGLNKYNYKEKAKLAVQEIDESIEGHKVFLRGDNGPRWHISRDLDEEPVILVTPKHILKKVTKNIFNIDKHGVKIEKL